MNINAAGLTRDDVRQVRSITTLVAQHFHLRASDLVGRARPWHIVLPRWIAWSILHHHYGYAPPIIARIFRRDDGTVTHGLAHLDKDTDTSAMARAAKAAVLQKLVKPSVPPVLLVASQEAA
jgi:chromosomal replication initiation ATPase DnaA